MSTTMDRTTDEAVLDLAAGVGAQIAAVAAAHDVDGTFVEEGLAAIRDAGLLALAVPNELGGLGAAPRQVAAVQRQLAHHCGSTALASSMHQHVVAFTAWRYRRGMPGAEATLRRVAEEGIVLVSTGGADFTHPRGEATKVDGGYRVSGHKVFASQSSFGTVLSTMFAYDDPEQGRRVLNMAVPVASPGVTVLDNWDTLGMRGTASNDIVLEDVFVPDERVLGNRPYGVIDPPLQVILSIAMPIVSAVYLGVAEAAFRAAVDAVAAKGDDPVVQRQVGLMSHRLRIASWALDRALDEIGDDPEPSMDRVAAALAAKREIALAGVEVCDVAMELGGGAAFFKGSAIERAYRDVRAAKFHPLTPEQTLVHAGLLALGKPADTF
jgi:alkylation response protein AidB-like acyl-CoA dehydrogenase